MLRRGFPCPETLLAASRCVDGEYSEVLLNREIRSKTVGTLLTEAVNQDERRAILADCARELRRFHDAGIIHGDCLPFNLCMDEKRRLCFIDNDRTKIVAGPLRRRMAQRNLIQFAAHSWLHDTWHNLEESRLFFSAYLGEDTERLPALLRARYRCIAELAYEQQERMLQSVSNNIFKECMRTAGEEEGVRFWMAKNSPLRDEELRWAVLHAHEAPDTVIMKQRSSCVIASVKTASRKIVVRKFMPRRGDGPFVPAELTMHLAMRRLGLPAPPLLGYFSRISSRHEVMNGIVVDYLSGSRVLKPEDTTIAAAMLAQLFALGFNHADFSHCNILHNDSTGATTIISLNDSSLVGIRNIPSLLRQAHRYIETMELPLEHQYVQNFIDETYGCIGDLPFSRQAFEEALRALSKRRSRKRERVQVLVPARVLKKLGGRWS
jgi:tRNA A-37 threonylcarbamoyl transferase component Bud32